MARKSRNSSPFSLFSFQDIITSVTGIMILVTMMLTLELLQRKEQSPTVRTAELVEQLRNAQQQTAEQITQLESELASTDAIRYDSESLRQNIEELNRSTSELRDEVQDLRDQSARTADQLDAVESEAERRLSDEELLAQLEADSEQMEDDLENLRTSNRRIYNASEGDSRVAWLVEVDGDGFTAAQVGVSRAPETFRDISRFLGWASGRSREQEFFMLLARPEGIENFYRANQSLLMDGFVVGYDLIPDGETVIDPETGAAP